MTHTAPQRGTPRPPPSPRICPVASPDAGHVMFLPLVCLGGHKADGHCGGKGSYIFDDDGKRYLDFSSQLVNTNIGHQHPKVVAAIKAQADCSAP